LTREDRSLLFASKQPQPAERSNCNPDQGGQVPWLNLTRGRGPGRYCSQASRRSLLNEVIVILNEVKDLTKAQPVILNAGRHHRTFAPHFGYIIAGVRFCCYNNERQRKELSTFVRILIMLIQGEHG